MSLSADQVNSYFVALPTNFYIHYQPIIPFFRISNGYTNAKPKSKKATRNFISPLTQINGDRFHFAFQSVKRQAAARTPAPRAVAAAAAASLPHAPDRKLLADTPLAAASKIICKCQCILTVCGDVFQITIYNCSQSQSHSNGNGKRKTEKQKNWTTQIYKWKQFSSERQREGVKKCKTQFLISVFINTRAIFGIFQDSDSDSRFFRLKNIYQSDWAFTL